MTVGDSWAMIEKCVWDAVPDVARTLRAGASPDDIQRLQAALNLELPEDFTASLMLHNGQDDPLRLHGLFNYNLLSSVDDIIADYEMLKSLFAEEGPIEWLIPDKIQNRIWCPGWVKFTESEGDGYVLDLSPAANGTAGQVFYRSHDDNSTKTTADSYAAFLERVAVLMTERRYSVSRRMIVLDELW